MSTVTELYGKSTFAFHRTIKCARLYLEKTDNHSQISLLPKTYPKHQNSLGKIDVAVKARILKTHLEDAFDANRFSVSITRRKDHCTISVCHDLTRPELMAEIIQLYKDDATKITLDTFASGVCE